MSRVSCPRRFRAINFAILCSFVYIIIRSILKFIKQGSKGVHEQHDSKNQGFTKIKQKLFDDWLLRDLDARPFPQIKSRPSKLRSCSCCGQTSNDTQWRGWGKGERRESRPRCPECGSVERHRLLCLFLKRRTSYFEEKFNVLEFTPFSKVMARKHNYTAADLNPGSYGTGSVSAEKIDITRIPRADSIFDFVFVSMILEHVLDEKSAIREVLRVLKPGIGLAYLSVPIDFRLPETIEEETKIYGNLNTTHLLARYGQKDHVRLYGRDVLDRWEKMGCKMEVVKPELFLNPKDYGKYVLDIYENLYLCRKE